ncbi:hypothetical protein FRC03_002051, partial [Tulasnella sp. 419]
RAVDRFQVSGAVDIERDIGKMKLDIGVIGKGVLSEFEERALNAIQPRADSARYDSALQSSSSFCLIGLRKDVKDPQLNDCVTYRSTISQRVHRLVAILSFEDRKVQGPQQSSINLSATAPTNLNQSAEMLEHRIICPLSHTSNARLRGSSKKTAPAPFSQAVSTSTFPTTPQSALTDH